MTNLDRRQILFTATAAALAAAAGPALAADPWAASPWRAITDAQWKARLPPASYAVLRHAATEPPYSSPLDKLYAKGAYACLGCGLPLFESKWKYDSHTGWPSYFTVLPGAVAKKSDFKLIVERTEYHCARCLGHQGHLFDDGPQPTGLRYCNNGVALKFIPA